MTKRERLNLSVDLSYKETLEELALKHKCITASGKPNISLLIRKIAHGQIVLTSINDL